MRKKSLKGYKRDLWKVFSLYIRLRDNGVCISCGKKDDIRKMDAGHYIPKTAGLSIYFDERNVHCQCTYCNRHMHGNLSKYALGLIEKYGDGILQELETRRNEFIKFNIYDYQELIEEYKERVKKYGER